jgi:hypothetical protein
MTRNGAGKRGRQMVAASCCKEGGGDHQTFGSRHAFVKYGGAPAEGAERVDIAVTYSCSADSVRKSAGGANTFGADTT